MNGNISVIDFIAIISGCLNVIILATVGLIRADVTKLKLYMHQNFIEKSELQKIIESIKGRIQ